MSTPTTTTRITAIRLKLARLRRDRMKVKVLRVDYAIDALEAALERETGSPWPWHPFEAAALGLAPFRLVDVVTRRGPIILKVEDGVTFSAGAPGQAMGCCSFCFTGIAECYVIRSADGRMFDVGCECVRNTGDRSLQRAVSAAVSKRRKQRAEERVDRVRVVLQVDRLVRNSLKRRPSPHKARAEALGESALAWCEWMLARAGAAGRTRVARLVEQVSREIDDPPAQAHGGGAG